MSNSEREVLKAIVHYQECLEKYARREDESKMMYCIGKLSKLPVTIDHLTQTGVGRTVNGLRKIGGEVGDHAKSLVGIWKEMVAQAGEEEEENEQNELQPNVVNKTDYKDDIEVEEEEEPLNQTNFKTPHSSDLKESQQKSRHNHKEHSTKKSSREKEDESKHSKKHKNKEHDSDKHTDKKETEPTDVTENKYKHKSSKRKHENGDSSTSGKVSKSSKEKHKDSDSDANYKDIKRKVAEYNTQVSKRKHAESESDHKQPVKTDKKHHKLHKKKYDSDSSNEQDNSDNNSEDEAKNVKKHNKSHSPIKEDKRRSHSKDKKDRSLESNSSHSSKDKDKSKHSSKDKPKSEKDDAKLKHTSKYKSKDHTPKTSSGSSSKSKVSASRDTTRPSSGPSFAEALGMIEPISSSKVKKKPIAVPTLPDEADASGASSPESFQPEGLFNKKLEPLNINISSLLPEITPNYKPMGYSALDGGFNRNKINTEDETLSALMYNKISRTKVYSGNKSAWGKVPSLFDICTRVLQDNIDALEFTGGVPYIILKPVLERANYNQLFMLEQYNPYLMEDTDELWQIHCHRDFRNRSREEMETWRDMYQRCLEERESKLRALTANIKFAQDKSLPIRQTKLAYVDSHSVVKPPRNIARKQNKHGTGGVPSPSNNKPAITPATRLVTLATAGAAGEISVPNPGPRAASTSSNPFVPVKPKKAPLMQKTLALMKNRFRR